MEFKGTTHDNLREELFKVQEKQEARLEMMSLARIKHCLEAMHQFGQVIEIFLNVSDAVAFVWGPMKFLLLTASTFADSFDSLLDAYKRIGEQLPLLAEYHSLFSNSPHMVDALELIYIDILDFHQQACKFFSGRLWVRFFKSMWKNFHTKFDGILSSLRRHKDIVECRATLVQYRLYQDDVADFKAKLEENVAREETKNLMVVKEWLSVGELPQLDHASYCKIRADYATTTKWISQHKTVKHWIHADVPKSPVVWMYGIPGAGKTILSSAIIDECKAQPGFLTCYFYCHDGDPMSSTAVGILKGLVDQLLDQYPQMLPPCFTRRRSSGEPSLRSLSQAKKLLEDFCNTIPKSFIVIDGLDECEKAERSQVLDILTEVVGCRDTIDPGTLRLLIASQDLIDIRKGFNSTASNKVAPIILRISETDNEGDIRAFTRLWVDKIASKFPPFSEDMKEYLQNLTVVNAKGMFLYAKLVLLDLYASTTLAELKDSIKTENFPHKLADAYERILRRIKTTSGRGWPKAKKLLGWLVCAKRRLTWKEMQVALSIDPERQIIDYENQRVRDHIYVTCGSLVLVNGDRVTLVHSTAKTYITAITKDIHEPSIECELATLCMQYLTFPCFDVDNPDDVVQRRRYALDGSLAFQDYAIAKWFHHINAWVASGTKFLEEAQDQVALLSAIFNAMEDFMTRYSEVDWAKGLVDDCKTKCRVFEHLGLYEHVVQLTSHIYTFQQKGFDASHKISISDLSEALDRNRKMLEEFHKAKPGPTAEEKTAYSKFYNEKRRYKCTRITCRYFSEGFKDEKSRERHVNIHERPYQCEIPDCVGAEGFVNEKDLEKHTRTFHPDKSDLAETFISAIAPKRGNTNHACSICGKTFSRSYHRRDHELSHKGERPHECEECGKAFTRLNDLTRHKKIHDRPGNNGAV
ncbi:hypothetical protein AA0112_g12495 [Alternaria arborescens]|nr:hypothetical protein AA0112_g12495 [Alternaria arborescens]